MQALEPPLKRLRIRNSAQLDGRKPVDVHKSIRASTGAFCQSCPIWGVGAAAGNVDAGARAVLRVVEKRRSKHAHQFNLPRLQHSSRVLPAHFQSASLN